MKPLLSDELLAERQLFMRMISQERVQAALRDFVSRQDPMPYLPRAAAQKESL